MRYLALTALWTDSLRQPGCLRVGKCWSLHFVWPSLRLEIPKGLSGTKKARLRNLRENKKSGSRYSEFLCLIANPFPRKESNAGQRFCSLRTIYQEYRFLYRCTRIILNIYSYMKRLVTYYTLLAIQSGKRSKIHGIATSTDEAMRDAGAPGLGDVLFTFRITVRGVVRCARGKMMLMFLHAHS